jgi:hypothetical protein
MNEEAPPSTRLPGSVRKYKNGKIENEQTYTLKLSKEFKPFVKKLPNTQGSDKRHDIKSTDLGKNIFDSDRKKANNFDDVLGTETSYNTSSKSVNKIEGETISYLKDSENRKKNVELVKKEFGALADLLNVKKTDEDDTFKIDLFVKKKSTMKKQDSGKQIIENEYEDDYIDIERDMDGVEKVKKMFDDFDMNSGGGGDDNLLDLMDMASQK